MAHAAFLLSLCLLLPLASRAQDAITERAYLEDDAGSLTWADVMQAPKAAAFQAYKGPLNRKRSINRVPCVADSDVIGVGA